jgi:glycosyltransferase involved in cell wall biosynthesis
VSSPEKIAPNIWYHALHVPKLGWLTTGYQGCVRAVRRKLREIRPDIVHGQGTEKECAFSAVWSGVSNVVTIHGNMAALGRQFRVPIGSHAWLTARLEDFTLPRTAGVFCNSAYTESLVRPRARRVWRVSNAVRLAFFETAPGVAATSSRPLLVNVGVICPWKRQLELVQVAETLSRRGLSFELVFIGRAPSEDSYARAFLEQIRPLERQGCIRYLGARSTSELIGIFDSAQALVHWPSEESFGLVVAEALARNLPVFASRTGGVADIATGVPGAELFDAQDLSGLTEALASWIKQSCPRERGAAQVMRQRYHPEVIATQHLEIYRSVLDVPV